MYVMHDCQWCREIFRKLLHGLMQFGKLFTLQIQIRKKNHENAEEMSEDFLNCNKYSAFFLMNSVYK